MADIYQRLYQKMERMGVFSVRQYEILEKPPYVPLCIDYLGDNIYALSQNPVIDDQLVADPDMEIRVDHTRRTAEPLSLQDPSGRRVVYPAPDRVDLVAKNDLARFLNSWLDGLLAQGFIRHQ
ncbi:hypothetical protein ASZ90_014837 [hydrocarbon metagenome]|uniref:DUF6908 domain-containing protein n=1 Tax=hydrocarbon metagenome TaxID=938273 RepID=A0A0W8F3P7_9ZZZZ